jgi:hypothetical protein
MKCIKAIKKLKNIVLESGTIVRVDDIEAESKVRSGYYKYVPKSEYKVSKQKEQIVVNPNHEEDQKLIKIANEISMQSAMTISEKQLKRGKTKAK